MMCDCGHKDERATLTAYGLYCSSCMAARRCPSRVHGKGTYRAHDRTSPDESREIREAYKRLRKKLPLEWSADRLMTLARRLVHRHNGRERV